MEMRSGARAAPVLGSRCFLRGYVAFYAKATGIQEETQIGRGAAKKRSWKLISTKNDNRCVLATAGSLEGRLHQWATVTPDRHEVTRIAWHDRLAARSNIGVVSGMRTRIGRFF